MNFNLTPVVKALVILNVICYIILNLAHLLPLDSFAVFYPQSENFRPYQIITYMFTHGSIAHIFFNMYGLAVIGPAVEYTMKSERFFQLYIIAGIGALLLQFGIQFAEIEYLHKFTAEDIAMIPMVGASGAVFGVLAAYGTIFPDNVLQLLFPPIALKAKYFVLIYAAIELYLGISNSMPGIAHYAHIGGALFGFLYVKYLQSKGSIYS
jgi:membrane associated rhomboid family serine protease